MRNTLSVNEREFVLRAHAEEQRIDGRRPFERRPPEFTVGARDAGWQALLIPSGRCLLTGTAR